jgi:hypothetical protein
LGGLCLPVHGKSLTTGARQVSDLPSMPNLLGGLLPWRARQVFDLPDILETIVRSLTAVQKSSVAEASALPPDVTWWLCPAIEMPFTLLGYALRAAFGPINRKG